MASFKLEAASIASIMTTEANALANGSGILGAEYDNGTNLYDWGVFELNVDFVSAPTAGTTVDLYLIPAPDGTNYDDSTNGASPYAPASAFVGVFPMQATTAAQKIPLGLVFRIPLPPCKFKPYIINRSGQAFPASGSTVKMIPTRYQSV
jgi:hypothetical protein